MIIGNLGEQADGPSTYDWILLGESGLRKFNNGRRNRARGQRGNGRGPQLRVLLLQQRLKVGFGLYIDQAQFSKREDRRLRDLIVFDHRMYEIGGGVC